MGLPLFIAPVESDTAPKSTRKSHTSSSPPRTAIRRLANLRAAPDRITVNRRARTLEHHDRRRTLPGIDEIGVTNISNRPRTRADVTTVARYMSMGFMSPADYGTGDSERERQRAGLINTMVTRFGQGWRDRNWEQPQRDVESNWWVVEPRFSSGAARLTRLGLGSTGTYNESSTLSRARHIHILPSASWASGSENSHPVEATAGVGRSQHVPLTWPPPPNDLDGLGDRQRSLSPEGWNTLLTTLTPDPQAPSASSSFVSNSASQSAGASSNTSLSGQPPAAGSAQEPEPPCDSGRENSDGEEAEATRARRLTTRRRVTRIERSERADRLAQPSEPSSAGFVRFWLPSLHPDSPTDGNASPLPSTSSLPASNQHRAGPLRPDASGEVNGLTPRTNESDRGGVWVGRLSVGASDEEESAAQQERQTRESSTFSRNPISLEDEEWTGMQRIVRSLADRQDIPDEWWLEAGLSRTISRETRRE